MSWFFEKISKIDNFFSKIEKQRMIPNNKNRHKNGIISQRWGNSENHRACLENLYPTKLESLWEIDEKLDVCRLPESIQDQISNLNILITSTKIEVPPPKKKQALDSVQNSTKPSKKNKQCPSNYFKNSNWSNTNCFCKASLSQCQNYAKTQKNFYRSISFMDIDTKVSIKGMQVESKNI